MINAAALTAALTLVLAAALAVPSAVQAAGTPVGTFGDWTVLRDSENGRPICYIGSQPTDKAGEYSSRGETYVVLTLRPSEKPHGVFSVEAGYAFADNSTVTVEIDGGPGIELFTRNRKDGKGDAWANSDDDDRKLIAAMKAGNRMVIKGRSSRGTVTTDTYSLGGFTRAHSEMEKACGR